MNVLRNEKGEFTVNGALMLLLVMVIVVLALTVLSIAVQSMRLNATASELTRYIEIRGKVDDSVMTELERLKTTFGKDITFSIEADYLSASDKTIQFGNQFTVTLTTQTSFGVGGILKVPITLNAHSPGRSEQYWKS